MANIDLVMDLFDAIQTYKESSKALAGVILLMWRADMILTENCTVFNTVEVLSNELEQYSISAIVLIHDDRPPEAAMLEDVDLDEMMNWILDHWHDGTVAVCIP